jgi:hypothetical protein
MGICYGPSELCTPKKKKKKEARGEEQSQRDLSGGGRSTNQAAVSNVVEAEVDILAPE